VTADLRVTTAREFLDGARRRKVTELPPSLLVRECAELRRQLAQVLDVIDGAQVLDEADRAIVFDGLAVAAEFRRYRASLTCEACAQNPAELCQDHATDLDRADEYDRLARQITEANR
jgi:hypothetical protein